MLQSTKDTVSAVVGVILIVLAVIFLAWLAVMTIRAIPSAFQSLAGIADELYGRESADTLTVAHDRNIVNSGETVMITWSDLGIDGTYAFSYECVDGVSIEVKDADGSIVSVGCGDAFRLPSDETSATLFITSTTDRFADVTYTISFTPENTRRHIGAQTANTLTAINPRIPIGGLAAADEAPRETSTTETERVTAPLPYTGSPEPRTRVVETTLPSDLSVEIDAIGVLDGGVFRSTNHLTKDVRNAVRFTVTNTGGVSSAVWGYTVRLSDGGTYIEAENSPLASREFETIILTLPPVTDDDSVTIDVTLAVNDPRANNTATYTASVR